MLSPAENWYLAWNNDPEFSGLSIEMVEGMQQVELISVVAVGFDQIPMIKSWRVSACIDWNWVNEMMNKVRKIIGWGFRRNKDYKGCELCYWILNNTESSEQFLPDIENLKF
mgnify:CR=1 FL=1